MQASQIPTKFQIPFGKNAAAGTLRPIPVADQTATSPGAASLTTGFPPATGQPLASGGIPPAMQDFNGLFNQITAWNLWQSAGATVPFDQSFCTAIGGYPQGAILASTAAGIVWLNTVDNNATNPDGTNPQGWLAIITSGNVLPSLSSSNARMRLKQQNVISDLYYDATANNDYQIYNGSATDLGTFTLPAGYVCILLEAAAFINGGTGSGTGVYLAIFSNANDGSGWIFQESQQVYKPVGQTVTISRPSLLSLDPTKSYNFTCRMMKDTTTTTATAVSGNLLGLAFKF